MKKVKVPIGKEKRTIELYTTFSFTYIENAQNVVMAICRAGYFVNMVADGTGYRVDIYKISNK